MGRHKNPDIAEQILYCHRHGETIFRLYFNGYGGYPHYEHRKAWRCYQCNREKYVRKT